MWEALCTGVRLGYIFCALEACTARALRTVPGVQVNFQGPQGCRCLAMSSPGRGCFLSSSAGWMNVPRAQFSWLLQGKMEIMLCSPKWHSGQPCNQIFLLCIFLFLAKLFTMKIPPWEVSVNRQWGNILLWRHFLHSKGLELSLDLTVELIIHLDHLRALYCCILSPFVLSALKKTM